jgi:hypothetical protein
LRTAARRQVMESALPFRPLEHRFYFFRFSPRQIDLLPPLLLSRTLNSPPCVIW